MSDGAHAGIGGSSALNTVLGSPPPPKKRRMTPKKMRAFLTSGTGTDPYDEACRDFGGKVLAWLDAHPEDRDLPTDDDVDVDEWESREYGGHPIVTRKGIYSRMKDGGVVPAEGYGLSGFQVGWAVNAARYASALPPTPNPALLEFTVAPRP